MNHLGSRNLHCALMFTLALLIFPLPGRDRQTGQSPAAQQDQGKPAQGKQAQDQKKKDQSSSKDNPPPAKTAQPADAAKSSDKPAPLFGGSLNIKSSRQTKDTATLGFNGVDDNGQVQKSFLSAAASGSDASAVQRMASQTVADAELNDFIQQGGLNAAAPPKKSSNPGGKP